MHLQFFTDLEAQNNIFYNFKKWRRMNIAQVQLKLIKKKAKQLPFPRKWCSYSKRGQSKTLQQRYDLHKWNNNICKANRFLFIIGKI